MKEFAYQTILQCKNICISIVAQHSLCVSIGSGALGFFFCVCVKLKEETFNAGCLFTAEQYHTVIGQQ